MGTLRQILAIKPKTQDKLPPKFKERWIEALTSGKYKQAKGGLLVIEEKLEEGERILLGHCCLGVAAKVCEVSDNDIEFLGNPDELEESALRRMPKFFRETDSPNPTISQLVNFNDGVDGLSFSFNQIAAWIKKYL